MFPPIFTIVSSNAAVRSALGTNPVRLFPFGFAEEGTLMPYAVWQGVGGLPENYMSNVPDIDSYLVQVDIYGTSAASVRSAAIAVRDALEPTAHVVSWRGESKDNKTHRYRYSFDVNFITSR